MNIFFKLFNDLFEFVAVCFTFLFWGVLAMILLAWYCQPGEPSPVPSAQPVSGTESGTGEH